MLIKASKHEEEEIRQSAITALGQIGDATTVPILIQALDDQHKKIRMQAAVSLGKIGDPSAVSSLIKALDDQSTQVRINATIALGRIGESAQQAIPDLTKVLNLADERSYINVVWALAQMGAPAVPALIIALNHNNEKVHRRAANALNEIGTAEAISALQEYEKKTSSKADAARWKSARYHHYLMVVLDPSPSCSQLVLGLNWSRICS